jgi:hypothetical protein
MTAWTGILIGGALGGVGGFMLSKAVFKYGDLGITGAAAAAGALIGGAMTAAKPTQAAQTSAATTPTASS